MGVGNLNHLSGYEEQFYITLESTFGVLAKPAGTDAIRIIESSFDTAQERVNREDKRNSRSASGRITRKKTCGFSLSMYILPSGVAGTPPDVSQALEALFGTYTNTPGTSDVYTLARDIDKSFSLHRIVGDGLAETLTGCVINEMKFSLSGEEEAKLEITGEGKEWVTTTPTTLDGDVAAAATSFTVVDDYAIEVGSVVQIGADDNGGAGYEVTAYNETTKVATISAVLVGASDGDAVVPFFPTAVTAGEPLGCFPGTISIDGDTICFTEMEVTINNNFSMKNDCFGYESAIGYVGTARREVTFSGTTYFSNDNNKLKAKSASFNDVPIIITVGDTAGDRLILNMPEAELNIIPIEIPTEEEVTMSIEGVALAKTTLETEISATFN